MDLKCSYYKTCILSIHRGYALGSPSNAKPLFLLAIMKSIEDGLILGNKIKYEKSLEDVYKDLCFFYEPHRKAAPMFKPFYHSAQEQYYDIKWKGGKMPSYKWHTPGAKFLRLNIEYAYLDDGLWDLLQDCEVRNEFKQLIENHYLMTKNI